MKHFYFPTMSNALMGGLISQQPGLYCPFNKERNKDSTGILQTAEWPLYAHRMNSTFAGAHWWAPEEQPEEHLRGHDDSTIYYMHLCVL